MLKSNIQKLTIKDAIPKNTLMKKLKMNLIKSKKEKKMVEGQNLVYTTNKYTYSLKIFEP